MNSLLHAVFFLSGVAALLFETLWFHQAGLALGNSVWASSLVLAGFMGGLGLGNALAARHGHRIRRPVRMYALLEVTIGVTGFAIVALIPAVGPLLAPIVRPLFDAPWLLNALRLVVSMGILIVPAAAMGATLPILVRAAVSEDTNFGRVLGRLYGWNTIGAVVGAITGETLLIGWLGIRGTAVVAALVNGIAAAGAAVIARRSLGAAPDSSGLSRPQPLFSRMSTDAWRLLGATFLAGASLLALEVIWFRFLLLFVHGSSLAFALMLATVLSGIGSGGLIASVWLGRRPDASRHAAAVALLAGILCVASYAGFRALVSSEAGYVSDWMSILARGAFLMFPVSLSSGVLFPLIGAALRERLDIETRAAGLMTLANTVGAMLGSLVAAFALLPSIGVEGSFLLLAASYGVVALFALRGRDSWRSVSLASATALFVAALAFFPAGLMQSVYLAKTVERFDRPGSTTVVGVDESVTETIILIEYSSHGEPLDHQLITNGYSMSGTNLFARRYMKLYVYWPVAVRPDPKRALLISFGVGSTAKALTDTESLETIDVVDISEGILQMSERIFATNENPLHDPRVRVHVEDGRYFLQTTERRFDLITGEPPPPKKAGIVNLYTREYFELVRDRLEERGVVSYWLPVHSLLVSDTRAIIRGFCDAFPDCSLWGGMRFDWMLVGTRGLRGPATEEDFSRQWRDPIVGPELRALGLETPEQLGALFMADAPALQALIRGVEPVIDDRPQRIARAPANAVSRAIHRSWMDTEVARKRFAKSPFIADLWPEALRKRTLPAFGTQRVINQHLLASARSGWGSLDDLFQVLTESRLETLPLWLLGSTADEQRIVRRLAKPGSATPSLDYRRALGAIASRDYSLAADLLERAAAGSDSRFTEEASFVECLMARRGDSIERGAADERDDRLAASFAAWQEKNCPTARLPSDNR